MAALRSPCVKLCVLDAADICEGCGRSLAEIAAWAQSDEAAQRVILARAAARRRARDGKAG
jgi:uncharacterized protein